MNEQELLNILFEVYRRDIKPENARNKILKALFESQSVSDNETKEKLCAFFNGCPNFTTDMSCSKGCGDYVEIAK